MSRRTALRAALGGAAAAAAFAAPRLEGFSLAPDYAAAATVCTTTSWPTRVVNGSKSQFNCCSQTLTTLCYTSGASNFCNKPFLDGTGCFNQSTNCGADTTGSLNVARNNNNPVQNVTLNYAVGGGSKEWITNWNNDSKVALGISGLGSPVTGCVATVNGVCGTGTFRISANNVTNNDDNSNEWGGGNTSSYNSGTITANTWTGASRRKVDCDGWENNFANASVAITIGLTCTC